MRAASSVSPAACLWPPNRISIGAHDSSAREHVEAGDAAARSVRDAAFDRQHDRRPVERVDQLRRDDADDAAVPALAGDDEHACATPTSGSVSTIFLRLRRRCPASSCRRRMFSASSCSASAARLVGHALRRTASSSRVGDVRRAHAAGGVDARRQHEADVIAVDRLAGQAGDVEQRAQADLVRSLRVSICSPSLAMTRFSPTSGTTSASVPIAAILTNAGSQRSCPVARQSACTSFSATPTPARFLSG